MRALKFEELVSLGYEKLKTMLDLEYKEGRVIELFKRTALKWDAEDVRYNQYLFDLHKARDEAKRRQS